MKKSLTLIAVLVMVLAFALLAGCGNKSEKADDNTPPESAPAASSQDGSEDDSSSNNAAAGGLSGKYSRTDSDDYFEFFSDGTCYLYNNFVDFKMDGKYTVSGNTITFAEGSEFDYDVKGSIDGNTIEWNGDVYEKE